MKYYLLLAMLLVGCGRSSGNLEPEGNKPSCRPCCKDCPTPVPVPVPPDDPEPEPEPEPEPDNEWIKVHNKIRQAKNIEPLTWSKEIEDVASAYAEKLKGEGCKMKHSSGKYGENLAWNQGFVSTPTKVFNIWASEEKYYDYDTNTCSGVCGHYTQIVWRKTKEIGCAVRSCNNGAQIWVCNYYPAGNMVGAKPY